MTALTMVGAEDMSGSRRMTRVIDTLGEMFVDLAAGRTRSPARTVIEHGDQRVLLVSPAVWERRGVGSVKITTLTPGNPERGLPLIHGLVALTDLETGQVTALLDGAELTAVRTGAVAALATRSCTADDADDLTVIGAGVQARALIRALAAVRPIRSVRIFSRTRARAEQLADWAQEAVGPIRATVCDSVKAAVADAAIVCTATSTDDSRPLVEAGWLARGVHVNVIGGTHPDAVELEPATLASAVTLVEDRTAALDGAGEVRAALAASLIGEDDLHELGRLVGGEIIVGGRTSVLRTVGMAIEDTAAAVALSASPASWGRTDGNA
ncbi:ornithine cyclodeaminase family protein [Couchioplanes caeruleus]|uniref:Ornithine cyclodeaminase n=2 Tax=Couchioplanes caeruleus TaxID=56438 RepID=A0A1K0GMK7_9ACTN|nr:ornithine cyclodeaminase family protein [Couchioplanes caeruleus]OJF12316.1 ornithine cyclodeaminase [Couchioplanes caeruleus subsp. caeruleus]ROP30431.1 ornithine cyclodeaminase [Couchioplanes caeruleus]